MFNNAGSKLKSIAKVVFFIGAGLTALDGLLVMLEGGMSIIVGFLSAVFGVFFWWLAVMALYALGVITENSDKLVELTGGTPAGRTEPEKLLLSDIVPGLQSSPAASAASAEKAGASRGKVCPECGAILEESALYCRYCGRKLD